MVKRIIKKILHLIEVKKNQSTVDILRKRGVKIGENTDIINTYIDGGFGFLCSIGNNTTLTGVTVLSHDASTKKVLGYSKIGVVIIGDNVFIGHGSIILPNVTIGNNVIIGAGTIIAKDVPDNVVIAGNPWRILSTYEEYCKKNKANLKKSIKNDKDWSKLSNYEKNKLFSLLSQTHKYGYNI